MNSGLLTLVPTRNRVENALELLDVFKDTITEDSSGLLFVVGLEDPRLEEYVEKIPRENLFLFPDRGLVRAFNYAAPFYTEEYVAIGFMGDDHRPRTSGWDERYLTSLDSFGRGGGFVYGDDLLVGERIPTQIAISSSIIRCLGFFGPPGFRHLCVDLAWKDLGESIRRIKYLPDVIIEHMHPQAGKAEMDPGYEYAYDPVWEAADHAEYLRWKRYDLPHLARRLAAEFDIVL